MQQDATPQDAGELSARQQAALPHVATNPSITAAAEAANVDRVTLHRWMNDDRFRMKVIHMREEASELAFAQLQGLMLKGIEVLKESLRSEDQAIRLKAARIALNAGLRAYESRTLNKRLNTIEDGLSVLKAVR